MGKSAGKWIKTVLLGKKYSKSDLSKNMKKTPEKTQGQDLTANSPRDTIVISPVDQGVDPQLNYVNERSRRERAATKAQAAFRGYLARRAFRALKGIIRLQAVIRGHLVRRQAVASFRCTLAIVKFQALARKVRRSDARTGLLKKYNVEEFQEDIGANLSKRMATTAFVGKILLKLPTAMPLSLLYDLSEPNSAWNWLERWSISRFWEMPAQVERVTMTKPQHFQSGVGKSRATQNFSNVANGANRANSSLVTLELEKPKYNPRKGTSNHMELELEEQPGNELERVKRNLRKISASAAAAFEKSALRTEKARAINAAPPHGSEQEKLVSAENLVNSDVLTDKFDLLEAPSDDLLDVTHDDNPFSEILSLDNGSNMESLLTLDDELNCKEDQNGNGNHKIQKRRSLPAKQDCHENISKNSRSLPSYMAATESLKAKLGIQGSPKFDEGTEHNIGRRHSLPASTNGTWSSLSPRMQKHGQTNGKGGNRVNKSLMTSRYEKVIQPGWRR